MIAENLKIIDWDRKGNVVRFYLGSADLKDWWGDDWDDVPYEHNAGTVYSEFVTTTIDIAFPFDVQVCEPDEGQVNSPYSKDSFKTKKVPILNIRSVFCVYVYMTDTVAKLLDTTHKVGGIICHGLHSLSV
jgi:hypothetical protein